MNVVTSLHLMENVPGLTGPSTITGLDWTGGLDWWTRLVD